MEESPCSWGVHRPSCRPGRDRGRRGSSGRAAKYLDVKINVSTDAGASSGQPTVACVDQPPVRRQPPGLEDQLGELVALDALEVDDDPAEATRRELDLEHVGPFGGQGQLLLEGLLQPDRAGRVPEVAERVA